MTSAEAYKCLQDHCGLQVGDRVKITRKATDGEMGWPIIWLDDIFDELIGQTFTITDFSAYGFLLDNKCGGYFPFFVLEKQVRELRHGDYGYYNGVHSDPCMVTKVSSTSCPQVVNRHKPCGFDLSEVQQKNFKVVGNIFDDLEERAGDCS